MTLRISPYETVGRYRLLGELGQGGTATVHLAVASGLAGFNKLVVLKKMKPQFTSEPGFAEMFLTEARLAARLNHPNIVQTNEVFEHEGLPVLVMEYLEGRSFADIGAARTPSGPFHLGHSLTVISEALSGLHYSHEATDFNGHTLELVHRDVTPHNVFVTYEGQVKILDFGIAKLKDSSVNTETGVVKGKLRYIPPEQIVGEAVDRRADLYAVGVMLWEIAAGEKLWRGMSDAAVMNRVINEKIPRPSEKNPAVDPAFEALIMKALSPDPNGRHKTALHLQQAVDEVRRGLPGATSARDLIPAMDTLFGADRTTTRKLVEARLSQLALGLDEHSGTPTSPTLKAYAAALKPGVARSTTPAPAWWPWLLPLAALAALAVFWAGRSLRDDGSRSPGAESASPSAADLRPDPRLGAGNRLQVGVDPQLIATEQESGDPSAAGSVALPSAGNPTVSVGNGLGGRPAASAVEAHEGRPPESGAVQRPRDAVSGPKRSAPPNARKPVAREAPPAAIAQCEPPYVVDSRGVKRFKRECVR
jgi:eukaryotic-like serine/threonine-protein kinase